MYDLYSVQPGTLVNIELEVAIMDKETSKAFQFHIGELLRAAREQAKPTMSQSAFANKYGCTKNYISEIELGNTKIPAEVLMWYWQEFDLDANDLFRQTLAEMNNATQRKR